MPVKKLTVAEPILTQTAAARAVGLPVLIVRRLIAAGRVPLVEVAGVRRVRLAALRSVVRERRVTVEV
jgi:hypothetical protein